MLHTCVLCCAVLFCACAGRARSRNNSRHKLDYQQVLDNLKAKGIAIRVASPKLVMEEAPESYKVGVDKGRGGAAALLAACNGQWEAC